MFKNFRHFLSKIDDIMNILYNINAFLMRIDQNAHEVSEIIRSEQEKLKLIEEKEKFLNADE